MESNYYSANPTFNRLSWMRQSTEFLRSALISPKTKFVLYKDLNALVHIPEDAAAKDTTVDGSSTLFTVPWSVVAPAIGVPDSEAGAAKVVGKDGVLWPDAFENRTSDTADDPLDKHPPIVFLGSDEKNTDTSIPNKPAKGPDQKVEDHTQGHPIWALDVSSLPTLNSVASLLTLLPHIPSGTVDYVDMRAGMMSLAKSESGLAGQGRALLDWHRRSKFCSGCGRPTHASWVGWKRVCTPDIELAPGAQRTGKQRPECFTKKGVHNFSYPRTDPVCIMAIVDPTGEHILLGRQKVWPKGFYSCLAGFLEPGESLEDAVKREVLEEAGIEVAAVRYHSTQPWAFPSSLMFGAIGVAERSQTIRTDLDNELEDARWFPRSTILRVLDSKTGSGLTLAELQKVEHGESDEANEREGIEDLKIRMPPRTAIAHHLIDSWARRGEGGKGLGPSRSIAKCKDHKI